MQWEAYRKFGPGHIAQHIVGNIAAQCAPYQSPAINVENELIDAQ
jgi:hypothetical protein